ncbi:hypothetical protein M0804_004544 [Polistes exclamans]|nr:hypothetical protein M0804_004544 [Polistes exclamans]
MKWSRGASRIIDVYYGVPQDVSIVCSTSYSAHGYTNAATTCTTTSVVRPMGAKGRPLNVTRATNYCAIPVT